jgi:hypothetical protein
MTQALSISEQDRLDRARDYAQVFETPVGQRVLDDLLHRICRTEKSPFAVGDPYMTAYLSGRHDVARDVLAMTGAVFAATMKPRVKRG